MDTLNKAEPAARVELTEKVEIDTQDKHIGQEMRTLNILYQDEHYVAIYKPAGLLVHRSPVDKYETAFAVQQLRDQIGRYVYPVHRLDKPTSGVLLFALSAEAARDMQVQFSDGVVEKRYHAIVRGFTPHDLLINHPVKSQVDKKYGKASDKQAKNAETRLKTVAHYELPFTVDVFPTSRYSLVELSPKTGRRHQLRYHMKHIAHPIIGDIKYGKGIHNRFFEQQFACRRLLLCATHLQFVHPYTKESIVVHTSVDEGFFALLQRLSAYNANV